MSDKLSPDIIYELLKVKPDGYLYHRERKDLEYKSSFSFAELPEYYKDMAAFANNAGGYLIFGISDSPRQIVGLKNKSLKRFDTIDPARIEQALLDTFSSNIIWEITIHYIGNIRIGVIYTHPSNQKPIISKRNLGDKQEIREGEIYFRYAGTTRRIQYGELQNIINQRINSSTSQLLSLINKISVIGPANAAILDTERGTIEKDAGNLIVIDEDLIQKIKFIREGHFDEKEGATTLKLVGEVHSMNAVEVTKTIRQRLIDQYPLSYTALVDEIQKRAPYLKRGEINSAIRENDVKNNSQYSAYNFRTKQHDEDFKHTGVIPAATPSLYNADAVEFLIKVLKRES